MYTHWFFQSKCFVDFILTIELTVAILTNG